MAHQIRYPRARLSPAKQGLVVVEFVLLVCVFISLSGCTGYANTKDDYETGRLFSEQADAQRYNENIHKRTVEAANEYNVINHKTQVLQSNISSERQQLEQLKDRIMELENEIQLYEKEVVTFETKNQSALNNQSVNYNTTVMPCVEKVSLDSENMTAMLKELATLIIPSPISVATKLARLPQIVKEAASVLSLVMKYRSAIQIINKNIANGYVYCQ